MVNLLRKLFIKDYQNVNNQKVRVKHGILSAVIGIISNLILFILKLLVGILSFSVSIITDAINNLSDLSSGIINIVGFKLSEKPADKKHPFGHERIEYIAGLIIALFIVAGAAIMCYQSIEKIIDGGGSNITYFAIIVLIIGILLKIWQGFFYKKMGKIINSSSLHASAQDAFNDVFATSAILISTIIEFINPNIKIDGYMGIASSIFIVVMGIKMVVETSTPLIGAGVDSKILKSVESDILKFKQIQGVHDLIGHSYGPTKLYLTAHVELDGNMKTFASHSLVDKIERAIAKKYNCEIVIHIDPIVELNEKALKIKQMIRDLIQNYSSDLDFHDFQYVDDKDEKVISFDCIIPFKSKIKDDEIKSYLIENIKQKAPGFEVLIVIDRDN